MTKYKLNFKLFFFIKILLIYIFLSFESFSDSIEKQKDFIVLGEDAAPIKIKIFSSLTCPHCANS